MCMAHSLLHAASWEDVSHSHLLSNSRLHSRTSFEKYTQPLSQTDTNFNKEGSWKRRTNLAVCGTSQKELHPTCTVHSPSSTKQAPYKVSGYLCSDFPGDNGFPNKLDAALHLFSTWEEWETIYLETIKSDPEHKRK